MRALRRQLADYDESAYGAAFWALERIAGLPQEHERVDDLLSPVRLTRGQRRWRQAVWGLVVVSAAVVFLLSGTAGNLLAGLLQEYLQVDKMPGEQLALWIAGMALVALVLGILALLLPSTGGNRGQAD